MSLKKVASTPEMSTAHDGLASGHEAGGQSATGWRWWRQPEQIGQATSENDETTGMGPSLNANNTYGTLRQSTRSDATLNGRTASKRRRRRNLSVSIPKLSTSTPGSPGPPTGASLTDRSFLTSRPLSAYDAHVVKGISSLEETEADAKTNGIRVWYSSFTSIDWLHDAIKDSTRQYRLRRRISKRGRILRQLDRSVGWIIVTIVGFLTAIVAFMIVRTEQWLFDIKYGYCKEGWLKSKQFCCSVHDDDVSTMLLPVLSNGVFEEACAQWKTWAEVFAPMTKGRGGFLWFEAEMIEYLTYSVIAVCSHACRLYPIGPLTSMQQVTLAVVSSFLTINLSASSSFLTRKDSGTLAASFTEGISDEDHRSQSGGFPRKVMYYVRAILMMDSTIPLVLHVLHTEWMEELDIFML